MHVPAGAQAGLGAMPASPGPGTVGPVPVGGITVTDQRGLLFLGG